MTNSYIHIYFGYSRPSLNFNHFFFVIILYILSWYRKKLSIYNKKDSPDNCKAHTKEEKENENRAFCK